MVKTFKAPWCRTLHIVSWFAMIVCIAASASGAGALRRRGLNGLSSAVLLAAPALVIGCGLFTVRGYVTTADTIFVRRLLWHTRISRNGLQSAVVDPTAMMWALRTFGIGGLFSFSGFYWTKKKLRTFRAYVTDPKNCVVLRFGNRTVVVSPEAPETFVRELLDSPH